MQLKVVQPRTCGECTLCCKILAVPELGKAADEWCEHAHRPVGCDVYATRPGSCRNFTCSWLVQKIPDSLRPDRIHGVMSGLDNRSFVLHEDPGYSGHAYAALRRMISEFIKNPGHYVVVVSGKSRRLIAESELLTRLAIEDGPVPGSFYVGIREEVSQ